MTRQGVARAALTPNVPGKYLETIRDDQSNVLACLWIILGSVLCCNRSCSRDIDFVAKSPLTAASWICGLDFVQVGFAALGRSSVTILGKPMEIQ